MAFRESRIISKQQAEGLVAKQIIIHLSVYADKRIRFLFLALRHGLVSVSREGILKYAALCHDVFRVCRIILAFDDAGGGQIFHYAFNAYPVIFLICDSQTAEKLGHDIEHHAGISACTRVHAFKKRSHICIVKAYAAAL